MSEPTKLEIERVVDALIITAFGDYNIPTPEFYKAARAAIAAMGGGGAA